MRFACCFLRAIHRHFVLMVVRTKKNSHEIRELHATMGISFWNVGMFFFPNKSLEKESHHILPLRFNQIFWLLSVIRLIFFSCSLLPSTKARGADQIQCFWNNTFSPVELNANKKIASTPLNKTNAFVLVVTQKPFYFLDNSFFLLFQFFTLMCNKRILHPDSSTNNWKYQSE